MAPPQVVTYSLSAFNSTNIVNAVGTIAAGNFTLATTTLDQQRRISFTVAGNESGNTFTIVGLNAANMTITENITGPNTGTVNSQLDYKTLIRITALTGTAGTVSIGTNGNGASLWQIVNWNAAPVNIAYGVVIQSGSANYSIQYTYDDPNNLPSGVSVPQAFNHPTVVSTTSNLDGASNDPITAWRLLVNSGTGTVRATGIQAGLASP
jgi:hypothetical protein